MVIARNVAVKMSSLTFRILGCVVKLTMFILSAAYLCSCSVRATKSQFTYICLFSSGIDSGIDSRNISNQRIFLFFFRINLIIVKIFGWIGAKLY